MERKKYDTGSEKLEEISIKLKEEQLAIKKDITTEQAKLEGVINDIKELSIAKDKIDNDLITEKVKKNNLLNNINEHAKEILVLENKIEILEDNIKNNSKMPNAVRSVLNNMRLEGVHNTIGNLLEMENMYITAIETALGSSANFLVTEDEAATRECIDYLKTNHLGRATFFPLTVIKERYVDYETLNILNTSTDFLGIMSDLVTYDSKFTNIIKNQLGTVIVVTTIDAATRISHNIKAKYKIVTLEGDVVNVGGSLSGGSTYNGKSSIILKQELKHLEEVENLLKKESEEIEHELETTNKEITDIEEKLFEIYKEKVTHKEKYRREIIRNF